ncbi:MAG: M48 family metalloprotease [Gemmatimonadota bacterium]
MRESALPMPAPRLRHFDRDTRRVRLLRAVPLLALTAATAAGCATNPVTGETQLALISESQEIQMGAEAAQQVEQSIGLVDDASLQNYVQQIGASLARDSERPNLPWTFRVVDDPTPNAFALPGGYIFITRGILGLMRSEAELAGVIGHEIGHVTARHSVTMISRSQIAQLGLGLGSILVPEIARFGDLASSGLSLLFLKYGRDAERQADELGFRYALDDGYDVRDIPNVFAQLQRAGEAAGHSPLPSWLSSHPYPEERIANIREMLAALPQSLDGTLRGVQTFMSQVDGLVYGENPRAGYFRDGLFLHPDLRFRVQFPQGWATQNLPRSVTAMSPDQDAMMQLSLAQGSETQAANAFFGAQGLAARDVSRTSINGLPAVTGLFQAQTQSGVLTGIAAFITLDNTTYQILAYGPAQAFPRYERLLGSAIGSFARLTDPQALNVQPNRIEVVATPAAMTLAEFNRRYPSVIPIAELALINQLSGGDARIPAGTQLKRIVSRS